MARKLNPELREAWRNRIEAQAQSGLSVAKFCEREGVASATFYGWKRKLRANGLRRTRTARPRQQRGTRPDRQKALSGTRSPVPFVQVPVSRSAASPWIEVVLAEGTVVRLPQQNLAALQTVLRTLGDTAGASPGGEVRYA